MSILMIKNAISTKFLQQVVNSIEDYVEEANFLLKKIKNIKKKYGYKDPNIIFDIIMQLGELNEYFSEIAIIAGSIERAKERSLKSFDDKVPDTLNVVTAGVISSIKEKFLSNITSDKIKEISLILDYLTDKAEKAVRAMNKYIINLNEIANLGDVDEFIKIAKKIEFKYQEFEAEWYDVYHRYLKDNKEDFEFDLLSTERYPDTEIPETLESEINTVKNPYYFNSVDEDIEPSTERSGNVDTIRPTLTEVSGVSGSLRPKTDIQKRLEEVYLSFTPDMTDEDRLKAYEEAGLAAVNPRTGLMELKIAMLKLQHNNFVNELKKAANIYRPQVLGAMLAKYSGQIEEQDFEASMKLLAIAEGIIEGNDS